MGAMVEFNFVLKLKDELDRKDFVAGKTLRFQKSGSRIYPIDVPMLLADRDWNIAGVIKVKDFVTNSSETKGSYEVIKVFDDNTAKIFTENYSKKYIK
ncbi:MAG: hypothetical protein AB1467_02610 [Candidatus Diapherotrites archaeon]